MQQETTAGYLKSLESTERLHKRKDFTKSLQLFPYRLVFYLAGMTCDFMIMVLQKSREKNTEISMDMNHMMAITQLSDIPKRGPLFSAKHMTRLQKDHENS